MIFQQDDSPPWSTSTAGPVLQNRSKWSQLIQVHRPECIDCTVRKQQLLGVGKMPGGGRAQQGLRPQPCPCLRLHCILFLPLSSLGSTMQDWTDGRGPEVESPHCPPADFTSRLS